MKRILQLSLVLNVVLIALAWRQGVHSLPLLREPRTAISDSRTAAARKYSYPSRIRRPGMAREATPWDAIESDEAAGFITRLRAIGCPEQTIRDIVTIRVCREYRNRLLVLEAERQLARDVTKNGSQREWREFSRQQSELRNEMIAKLESLLGVSWNDLVSSVRGQSWGSDSLAFLTAEKRAQVRTVVQAYRDLQQEFTHRRLTEGLGTEDLAQLKDLGLQKRAALAQFLTPQELNEYQFRQSDAADYVRQKLPPAKSEAEFRAMVTVALELGMSVALDPTPPVPGLSETLTAGAQQHLDQLKAAFDQRLKEILGAARVAEQQTEQQALAEAADSQEEQRQAERARTEITALAESVGVSVEDAGRFFARLRQSEAILKPKFDEMEKSLTGTPDEKKKQMVAAIKTEMERIAVETIGEKGRALVEKMAAKTE